MERSANSSRVCASVLRANAEQRVVLDVGTEIPLFTTVALARLLYASDGDRTRTHACSHTNTHTLTNTNAKTLPNTPMFTSEICISFANHCRSTLPTRRAVIATRK